MNHIIIKNIICEDSENCSDNIIAKLEKKFNCKLMANNKSETVHGSISILHDNINKHKITVEFYDKNETRKDLPTLKKLSNIPTESEIKKII